MLCCKVELVGDGKGVAGAANAASAHAASPQPTLPPFEIDLPTVASLAMPVAPLTMEHDEDNDLRSTPAVPPTPKTLDGPPVPQATPPPNDHNAERTMQRIRRSRSHEHRRGAPRGGGGGGGGGVGPVAHLAGRSERRAANHSASVATAANADSSDGDVGGGAARPKASASDSKH